MLLGQRRSFADFEQSGLHELRGEQRQLCVAVWFALEPADEPAVQVRRIRFGEQLVEGVTANEVGIHSAQRLPLPDEQACCQTPFPAKSAGSGTNHPAAGKLRISGRRCRTEKRQRTSLYPNFRRLDPRSQIDLPPHNAKVWRHCYDWSRCDGPSTSLLLRRPCP